MSGDSQVLCGLHALEAYLDAVAAQGETLALVPTMGALHDGHLSLVEYARQQADRVMMSIFVNPTQFAPGEDFLTYPREPHSDQKKAFEAGCHAIFMPDVETMYPQGSATTVVPGPLAHALCGASRPGHFEGVCTVVLKLLNLTGCQHAIFGRKDFQQLAVIRSMVRDLNVSTTIHGCPIVREPDGLAMSSRNARLTPGARNQARALWRGLDVAKQHWLAGQRSPRQLEALVRAHLHAAQGAEIEYVEAVDPDSLRSLEEAHPGACLLAVAVHFGDVRLIDNVLLNAELVT